MITGPLRSKIDKLWEEFWTGGITNPLTVIEQISFLLFARLLDANEQREEKKFSRQHPGKPFPGVYFTAKQQRVRWKNLKHEGDADKVLKLVRDDLFALMRGLGERGTTFGNLMKDAQLMVQKPALLKSAIAKIDELPLLETDTKGDLYEYLLSKLTTAGINGQFRTPRHIIELMVKLADPKPDERICDPACGTAGFLVGVLQYLYEKYTSSEGIHEHEENGKVYKTYTGDLLEKHRKHIASNLLTGFDFDSTMLRIAAMNATLHGVDTPRILYQDTLSTGFGDKPDSHDAFDLILANPPFKGSLDVEAVSRSLTAKVKTRKTELLFLVLILRMLKLSGRALCIVPDGVLFGSSNAHVELRKLLVAENQLEAVISLPSGVFKPYAGVSTAILFFTKGGKTDHVFFYDVTADGYSLDDKRDPIKDDDLPDVLARYRKRSAKKDTDRTAKHFMVPLKEIEAKGYDLSINRYKETKHEEVSYESPKVIIAKLRALEAEIAKDLGELESML